MTSILDLTPFLRDVGGKIPVEKIILSYVNKIIPFCLRICGHTSAMRSTNNMFLVGDSLEYEKPNKDSYYSLVMNASNIDNNYCFNRFEKVELLLDIDISDLQCYATYDNYKLYIYLFNNLVRLS